MPSYRKLYGEPFERLRRILIGVRSEKNCPINLVLSTVKNVAVMEFASPDGQWDPLGDLLNKWVEELLATYVGEEVAQLLARQDTRKTPDRRGR